MLPCPPVGGVLMKLRIASPVVANCVFISAQSLAVTNPSQAVSTSPCGDTPALVDSIELFSVVGAEFQKTHGLILNWTDTIGVGDDEEGAHCVFSVDSGHSVTLPMGSIRYASPNKVQSGSP